MNQPLVALLCPGVIALASAKSNGLIIRHGRSADDLENPAFLANMAVNDGRIVAIGRMASRTKI